MTSELPQPQHFATEFTTGPDGYLVQSVKTGSGADAQRAWDAIFAYHYQAVRGIQIPAEVTGTQVLTGEKWDYSLEHCKVVACTIVNVQAPEK